MHQAADKAADKVEDKAEGQVEDNEIGVVKVFVDQMRSPSCYRNLQQWRALRFHVRHEAA